MKVAQRGVEIAPDDADAQSILAWCSYNAGATRDSVLASTKAVDLDPTHADAIWIAILARARDGDIEGARAAFEHAVSVRSFLARGFDESFIPDFQKALEDITSAEMLPFVIEVRQALATGPRSIEATRAGPG
jgi:tetratricopeptide (TPR) repeat protein